MTSHSPASSPELPKLPSGMRASAHASDLIVFHAFDMEAYGRACYEAGSAAAAQAAKQVPAGFVLVPREPTSEMLDAATDEEVHVCEQGDPYYSDKPMSESDARKVWQAMIAAAPSATSLAEAAEAGKVEANEARTRAMNAALIYRNADPEAIDEQDAWAALIDAIGALAATPALQEKKQ